MSDETTSNQKSAITKIIETITGTLMKGVTFRGRATKGEFWLFVLFVAILNIIFSLLFAMTVSSALGKVFAVLIILVTLALLVCFISLAVRRLHDLGLSGFWLWYLSSWGLPVVFMAYLLDLDNACNRLIDKVVKNGNVVGWILTILAWPVGAPCVLTLLFLYSGKAEDNEFGPNPYEVK